MSECQSVRLSKGYRRDAGCPTSCVPRPTLLFYGLRRRRTSLRLVWTVVCGLLLTGCGYTTAGFFYAENKIFISPVINKVDITSENRSYSNYTTFPILIEKRLTNLIIAKFNRDGHLKVVNTGEEALTLACVVRRYEKEGLRYDNQEDVEEQRLRLHVEMILRDSQKKELKNKEVVGETTYYLSAKSEESAQEDLIEDAARRILEAVVEEW